MPSPSPTIPTPATPRTIYTGVLGIGQSLSAGYQAPLTHSTPAIPHAYKLNDADNTYSLAHPTAPSLSLSPLTEPLRPVHEPTDAYPHNIAGQTPHTAFAATLAHLLPRGAPPRPTVHTCVGAGGASLSAICKGGTGNGYEASLYEARALKRLVGKRGGVLRYEALLLTHGEADALMGVEGYAKGVVRLWRDYCGDLEAVTGERGRLWMILSQQHTCPLGVDVSEVVQGQWYAQVLARGGVVCAGPKYQYGYPLPRLHLDRGGYNRLGEKYGQVFHQTVVQRRPFVPLAPKRLTRRSRAEIEVEFHVPVPPLRWDAHMPAPHQREGHPWRSGRGFEVRDAQGAEVGIAGVEIVRGGRSVRIELQGGAAEELSEDVLLQVAYAMTPDEPGEWGTWYGGVAAGRMGLLCDGDALPGGGTCAEVLVLDVVHGQAAVECAKGEGFAKRAQWDVVEFVDDEVAREDVDEEGWEIIRKASIDEAAEEVVIVELPEDDKTKAVLSKKWMGPSGTRRARVRHNQRNYCVSFVMPVDGELIDMSVDQSWLTHDQE